MLEEYGAVQMSFYTNNKLLVSDMKQILQNLSSFPKSESWLFSQRDMFVHAQFGESDTVQLILWAKS